MPTQAPASDAPFYGIFLSHKKSLFSKMLDDVIACDLRFGFPPPIKNSGYAYAPRQCFFLTLIIFDWKTIIHSRIWIALARLRSKLLKYLRRESQRNCIKIIAAQALS